MKKLFLFILIFLVTACTTTTKTEALTFKAKKAQNVKVEIYNPLGIQIKTIIIKAHQGDNCISIDSKLGNGIYFIKIRYTDDDEIPYWAKEVKLEIDL